MKSTASEPGLKIGFSLTPDWLGEGVVFISTLQSAKRAKKKRPFCSTKEEIVSRLFHCKVVLKHVLGTP